jgi:hypothetical protein
LKSDIFVIRIGVWWGNFGTRCVGGAVVKLAYLQGRIVQVFRGSPSGFVVACPVNWEQRFAIVGANFKDFYDIPLLLFSNDSGGRRWLLLSLKRIVGWGFKEGDEEYLVYSHEGGSSSLYV